MPKQFYLAILVRCNCSYKNDGFEMYCARKIGSTKYKRKQVGTA